MMKVVRGFYSVAYSVKLCKPNVICAYPITPQTEIVERLAEMYANGELGDCEYITAESEFGSASILVGASAAGARTFTATCSQGLILMSEVLWNAAGMRLPIVIVNANRSLSAPLSIWNDHQDSMAMRDAGIIQVYVENNQEVHDMIPQAFKVAEDRRVMLPFMVCMDGYKLTHAYEPVDLLSQELVDSFLPPYDPPVKLTTKDPLTFGSYATPATYMEFRAAMHNAMERARKVMDEVFKEWAEVSGRNWGGHIANSGEGAEVYVIAMGSLVGLVRDVVDELRKDGKSVDLIKLRTFRPFPADELRKALSGASKVIVFERSLSLGSEPPVTLDVKSAIQKLDIDVYSLVVGLGGRDVPRDLVKKSIEEVIDGKVEPGMHFRGLKDYEEVIV
ncbi:transketolase C-terminal domain-containing protein [Archaeoglobus veneficus]|uniref:Pyruvate synthase n=1 Tax=Archaeoglobus veneficus (strain DSM 11195 / SNP6) TaxID=693661 RepID=F2KML7_ARCVS|nr:transketolase C-terminal domain-containing protein [Archaeoglobus veneficus]AEA47214.1 Pyruvate synthase [Archaeoglobus veneficus SNP6]